MNSKEWRKRGYKTIFRNGLIYLYRPLSGVTIQTEVNGGKWMDYDNVNEPPWKCLKKGENNTPIPLRKIAKSCYCDQGVDVCDYCSGVRMIAEEREK